MSSQNPSQKFGQKSGQNPSEKSGQKSSERDGVNDVAVESMLSFQQTGTGFEALWERIGPTVDGMLRGCLRKRSVKGHRGGDDEVAVADTTQQVMTALWEVPGKGPRVWFDPGRKASAVDALRAWLCGFCTFAVARYCEQWRGARRRRKVLAESALPLNEQTEYSSILKSIPAKIEVEDGELQQIVNECLATLPEELRTLIRLNFWEGRSVRDLDESLGIHESTIQRRLTKARASLRTEFERRGIDASWLGCDRPRQVAAKSRRATGSPARLDSDLGQSWTRLGPDLGI